MVEIEAVAVVVGEQAGTSADETSEAAAWATALVVAAGEASLAVAGSAGVVASCDVQALVESEVERASMDHC